MVLMMVDYRIWLHGKELLAKELQMRGVSFDAEMKVLKKEYARYHLFTINRNKYWYRVMGKGKWKYVQPAKSGDPRETYKQQIAELEAKRKTAFDGVRAAVVEEMDKDLIIDFTKFKPELGETRSAYKIFSVIKMATEKAHD